MTALNNEQLIKQAVEQFKNQGFKETFVFDTKEKRCFTHATDKNRSFKVKRDDAQAMLTKLAELEQQKQKEEYQKNSKMAMATATTTTKPLFFF